MNPTLGNAILKTRKSLGKTLRGFASEVGISPSLLSLIEQEKHIPPADLIVRIAKSLGTDADKLCGLAGMLTPDSERTFAETARKNPEFFRRLRMNASNYN